MVRETIILTQRDVEQHVDLGALIPAIERCYADHELGEYILPPKFLLKVGGGQAACMTGCSRAANRMTMKLGQERLANAGRNLPTSFGVINLFDTETGELLLIVESMLATQLRTAAAAAVGVKHLARVDAHKMAMIGAGRLGRQCLRAICHVRPIDEIFIFDLDERQAHRVTVEMAAEIGVPMYCVDAATACRHADIICTATNSLKPVVMTEWVRPGTHLSCMGADLHEKIECEMTLIPRCRILADYAVHCVSRGEASQAIEAGFVASETAYAGNIGQVINGTLPGRQSPEQITMFDSIGLGILDTTLTSMIYDQASQQVFGLRIAL